MRWLAVFLAFMLLTTAVQAAPTKVDTAKRLYDRVMQEFQRKDYEAALAGFRFFLELHGRSPLASSAQYWIGECEFRLGRYREAMESFEKMLSRYPSSPKVAAATLKKALTYEKLGHAAQARILLERVLVDFPNTQEAEVAKKTLKQP
jgi:tol-pal system protein YbgF